MTCLWSSKRSVCARVRRALSFAPSVSLRLRCSTRAPVSVCGHVQTCVCVRVCADICVRVCAQWKECRNVLAGLAHVHLLGLAELSDFKLPDSSTVTLWMAEIKQAVRVWRVVCLPP